MNGVHDPLLVVLSVVVAIFASYTALDLANSITVVRGRARLAWLLGGGVAMGIGIWSMHFVGMLAFQVRGMPIAYDVPLVVLSVTVAIAGMHYIGMWSMRMPARILWNPLLVAASIRIAIAASFAALWVAFRYRADLTERARDTAEAARHRHGGGSGSAPEAGDAP